MQVLFCHAIPSHVLVLGPASLIERHAAVERCAQDLEES